MATLKELLDRLPIGSAAPKKVLAALKRRGVIYSYSTFGYLESQWVYYFDADNRLQAYQSYTGKPIMWCGLGSANYPYASMAELAEAGKYYQLVPEFEYMRHRFKCEYLPGCFNPYLILAS